MRKLTEEENKKKNERKKLEKKLPLMVKLNKKLGTLKGAGHFIGLDTQISGLAMRKALYAEVSQQVSGQGDGVRDPFDKEDVREVLRFLSLGAKKVNFKESDFRHMICDISDL